MTTRIEVAVFTLAAILILLFGAALAMMPSTDDVTPTNVTVYQDELGWQGR